MKSIFLCCLNLTLLVLTLESLSHLHVLVQMLTKWGSSILICFLQVSKILLHTSGRVLSGAVTVVFGGATVIYDIYRLNSEVQTLAGKGKDGAEDIRFEQRFVIRPTGICSTADRPTLSVGRLGRGPGLGWNRDTKNPILSFILQ